MRYDYEIPESGNHRSFHQRTETERPAREFERSYTVNRETNRKHSQVCDGHYHLSGSQLGTLKELATFRAIPLKDLAEYRYANSLKALSQDLEGLLRQNLVKPANFYNRDRSQPEKFQVFTITREASALLNKHFPSERGYSHVTKRRELLHDCSLYRMYQKEAAKIQSKGGTNPKPILDYDIKRRINRELVKLKTLPLAEQEQHKRALAEQHGLKVVEGKIALPDLRIEYETSGGDPAHVDLELVTEHYKAHHMQQKAAAGFTLYSQGDGKARPFGPELAQEIFSL